MKKAKEIFHGALLITGFLFIPYFFFDGHGIIESILISIGLMIVLGILGLLFGVITRFLGK